jgi:small subunit ribosomal protein S16
MVVIRLSPIGKKGEDLYKIGVSLGRKKLTGKYLEKIGIYQASKDVVYLKQDRLDAWIKNGAQVSVRVRSILKLAKPMPVHQAPVQVKRELEAAPQRTPKPVPAKSAQPAKRGGPANKGGPRGGSKNSN